MKLPQGKDLTQWAIETKEVTDYGLQKPKSQGKRIFLAQTKYLGEMLVKLAGLPTMAEWEQRSLIELRYDRGERRWTHELTEIKFLPTGKKEVAKQKST